MILLVAACAFAPKDAAHPDGASCEGDEAHLACAHETVVFGAAASRREVHVQVPLGEPPEQGWPVAVLFQGSLYSGETFWEADRDDPFGGWWQVVLVRDLLDAGFAVLTPEAQGGGRTWWDTNVLPWSWAWERSEDHRLMLALLDAVADGTLGPLDADRLYAAGISSGGYMTSRMAEAYPGRFHALAIQSASWATCSGALCVLPGELPAAHPPTLFLHGERDTVVPIGTMRRYADALDEDGVEVREVTDADEGHAWLEAAPGEIVGWFASR